VVVLEEKEVHLVKRVSKELGITYKELAENIGYTEANLKRSVSTNQISKQLKTSIELYLKTIKLEKEVEDTNQLKKLINTFLNK
jgi:hypothetical protein